MSEIDHLNDVLKQAGVKFMLIKCKSGYAIEQQNDRISKFNFRHLKVVGENLDYDEAVALIRILEGDKHE